MIDIGKKFYAQRKVLFSSSDYFQAMFSSGMKDSSDDEIELKGISSKGLEKVIQFMCTSTITLDEDDVNDVIEAAMYLQVRDGSSDIWTNCLGCLGNGF